VAVQARSEETVRSKALDELIFCYLMQRQQRSALVRQWKKPTLTSYIHAGSKDDTVESENVSPIRRFRFRFVWKSPKHRDVGDRRRFLMSIAAANQQLPYSENVNPTRFSDSDFD
jgi:hypothetical protein